MEKVASQATSSGKPITTFVHTDTKAFREVVQRLTGPSGSDAVHGPSETAAAKFGRIKRSTSTSNLHERRLHRPKLEIVKPSFYFTSYPSPNICGRTSVLPSPMGSPSTIFSKLSIQEQESIIESAISKMHGEEEEKAIKEKGFYLHPSPQSKAGYVEPELLNLFPLTSPKTSEKP